MLQLSHYRNNGVVVVGMCMAGDRSTIEEREVLRLSLGQGVQVVPGVPGASRLPRGPPTTRQAAHVVAAWTPVVGAQHEVPVVHS